MHRWGGEHGCTGRTQARINSSPTSDTVADPHLPDGKHGDAENPSKKSGRRKQKPPLLVESDRLPHEFAAVACRDPKRDVLYRVIYSFFCPLQGAR